MSPITRKASYQRYLRYAVVVLMAMMLCLGVTFIHVGHLMGEHHDKHVPQDVEDHPAMASHSVGTEPLDVRVA